MSAEAGRMKAHTESPQHKIIMEWWDKQIEKENKEALDNMGDDDTSPELAKIAKRAKMRANDFQELRNRLRAYLINYMQE
jgi:hypothetical protein